MKTKIQKRNQANKVKEKLLESLPHQAFTEVSSNRLIPLLPTEPMASSHKRRKNRHQNHRAFSRKGFVYNGACPAGYA